MIHGQISTILTVWAGFQTAIVTWDFSQIPFRRNKLPLVGSGQPEGDSSLLIPDIFTYLRPINLLPMKLIVEFVVTLFSKRKKRSSMYYEAVSEGIKEALAGMEPQPDEAAKNNIADQMHSPYCINR
jgi:hypothetical protein